MTEPQIIKRSGTIFLFLWLFVGQGSISRAQSFKTKTGNVIFKSSVPLHSFEGSSHRLNGRIDLADSTVDFYLDLNTLDTGNSKRDKDMRNTLDTEKYPFAEFYGKLTSGFNLQSDSIQQVITEGEFKMHGAHKKITVKGTLQKTREGLKLKAKWVLYLKDFNIDPPGILFYKVDQEQHITINVLLTPEQN